MSTTTIRLSDELKARVSRAAESAGTTAHSFILDAIAEKTEAAERQGGFHREAEQRYAKVMATGMTIPWEQMRQYLQAHAGDERPSAPSPRKLAR